MLFRSSNGIVTGHTCQCLQECSVLAGANGKTRGASRRGQGGGPLEVCGLPAEGAAKQQSLVAGAADQRAGSQGVKCA